MDATLKVLTPILLVAGVLLLVLGLVFRFAFSEEPAPTKAMPSSGIDLPSPPSPVTFKKLVPPPIDPAAKSETEDKLGPGNGESSEGSQRQAVDPGPVLFFEHGRHSEQFPGRSWSVPQGLTSSDFVLAHDVASSLRIPAGLQATLFEDEGGRGHRLQLGPGFHNLASYGFDDIVSSVRVAPLGQDALAWNGPSDAVELYEHRESHQGDRGASWKLVMPLKRTQFLFVSGPDSFANNSVSAAWVPPGLELSLFDQRDGWGAAMVLGPGYHELDFVDFNDRASSARVQRSR